MGDSTVKYVIITSDELTGGGPLNADYYVNRKPGESYEDFTRRRKTEDLERRAQYHERQAFLRRREAEAL